MRSLPLILFTAALLLCACRRTPSGVIPPSDMAEVLADIYVAEGVVNNNQNIYREDSMKKLLKQSVFAAHGITQAEFDTSMVWYGHNLKTYIDVHDRVIKILEKRNVAMGNAVVQLASSIAGDSVDVWPASKYAAITKLLPSKFVKFDIQSDPNWEPGDIYTWRMKLLDDNSNTVHWTIVAEYDDNSTDWLYSRTSSPNWNEVTFVSDSTLTLKSIKGYFEVAPSDSHRDDHSSKSVDATIWIDSISLIRKRTNSRDYNLRFRLRHYGKKNDVSAPAPDSVISHPDLSKPISLDDIDAQRPPLPRN